MTLVAEPARPSAGRAASRIEGPDKVTGQARYAFEHPIADVAYAWPVQATIAKGEILGVRAEAALALPGVLAVITPDNAPRLPSAPLGDRAAAAKNRPRSRNASVLSPPTIRK